MVAVSKTVGIFIHAKRRLAEERPCEGLFTVVQLATYYCFLMRKTMNKRTFPHADDAHSLA